MAGTPPWESEAALRLPFDQYQRYTGAAKVVDRLMAGRPFSMLEVGGAPGFPELFFAPEKLAVVDRFGHHEGNFVVVDGAKLPFDDEAFDVVVTLDTLEHVVPEDRPAFLAECRRVSRELVVLSAPHATPYVVEAERALQSFVTARFGEVFETLQEHSDRGLPVAESTQAQLGADGWASTSLPSGYLPRWLMGMVVHHELLAVGMPELPDLHSFYNRLMGPYDNAEPGYRRLVVSSRTRSQEELDTVRDALVVPAPPGHADTVLTAIAGRLLSERVGYGQAEQVRRSRAYDTLTGDLAGRVAEVEVLRSQLDDMTRRHTELAGRVNALEDERRHLTDRLADAAEHAGRTGEALARRRSPIAAVARRLRGRLGPGRPFSR